MLAFGLLVGLLPPALATASLRADQISERTYSALAELARSDRPRSRFVPFGYRTSSGATTVKAGDDRLVKHPDEQRTLRRMVELRKRGKAPKAISDALNKEGRLTRNRKAWDRKIVWQILDRYEERQAAIEA